MAWTDLTFVECSVLTAAKMTQLQGNFAALAAGEPGAPPLHSDGVSSLALLHASSGLLAPQVSSVGLLHVGSGIVAPQVSSLGRLHVSSGTLAPGVSSLALLQVGSGIVAPQVSSLGTVHVSSAIVLGASPSGTPAANTLYADNICKGWINFNGTGSIAIRDSFNVTSITDNGTGDYTVTWDRDFSAVDYMIACGGPPQLHVRNSLTTPDIAVGSVRLHARDALGGLADSAIACVIAIGAQT